MRFVLATGNPDKAAEISTILGDAGLPLTLEPRGPSFGDTEETGDTLEDNARLKAINACRRSGLPAIADDTGLEVDALGGAPGVRSARFAGESASYEDNVRLLLDHLREVPDARRTARFATVAIARWPDGTEVAALGTVGGIIAREQRGLGGFGYDPVFVPSEGDGRTFGEMTNDEKHAHSHRGRAFRTLAEGLRAVLE